VPKGFEKTYELLSKSYKIILAKVDEISKVDAGLSCMSLRW
jgi:N-dimethylarginine dimethylaminohydrolase